jgi:hypothetical protein
MMQLGRLMVFSIVMSPLALVAGACADDSDAAPVSAGGAAATGGSQAPAGGADSSGAGQGGSVEGSGGAEDAAGAAGVAGAGGGSAGGSSTGGDAGAGGAPECFVAECEGLDEATCTTIGEPASGCTAIYGQHWPGEPDDPSAYAGCATRCCGADCPVPHLTPVCAHPAGDPNDCWMFPDTSTPDGWIVLDDSCDADPQCSE